MSKVVSTYIELHIMKIENDQLKFLLLKRSPNEKYPNIWQMVTGKIRDGEKAYETALRELKEETGLIAEELFTVPIVNSVYLSETDEVCLIPVFLCRVNEKSEIKISEEHSEYKWLNAEEAEKLLNWEGQKKSIRMINDYWINSKEKLIKIFG
ncbi:MAG: NUDIX pyrophosphatase [Ignavibacteria bacterium]|jgi:dATP pyrophosphohydrolase|nr:NUDIX pyrophosphatase [Ignavibacteria bacterium]